MTEMKSQCREGNSVHASPVYDIADGKNSASRTRLLNVETASRRISRAKKRNEKLEKIGASYERMLIINRFSAV